MRTQETMWGTLSPAQPWAQCCKAKGSQKKQTKKKKQSQFCNHQALAVVLHVRILMLQEQILLDSKGGVLWLIHSMLIKMEPILLFLGKRIVLRTHIHKRTHSSCSSHLLTGSQLIFFCTLKFNGLFFFFLFFLLVTAPTMRNSPLITEAHHEMPFISESLTTSDATATCF